MTVKSLRLWFKKYSKLLGALVALLLSVLIFVFRDKLIYFQNFGYIGIFLLSILGSATIISAAPVFLLAISAGSIFHPLPVAILMSLGSALGEVTAYFIGAGGEKYIENSKAFKKIDKWMEKRGLWIVFTLAAIPSPVFDLAGIVAGASGIPIKKFLLATWAGRLIRYSILAYLGSRLI
jgi:uncharacterized membrane protein YdjX (TVP38/TMEM64 family)